MCVDVSLVRICYIFGEQSSVNRGEPLRQQRQLNCIVGEDSDPVVDSSDAIRRVVCSAASTARWTLPLTSAGYSTATVNPQNTSVLLRSSCRSITPGRDSVSGGHT